MSEKIMDAIEKLEIQECYSELGNIKSISMVSGKRSALLTIRTETGAYSCCPSPSEWERVTSVAFRLEVLHGWECYPFVNIDANAYEVGWTVEKS